MKSFAAPDQFGVDIWETTLKLTEEFASKAESAFIRDSPDAASALLEQATQLGTNVDRFRPAELPKENVYAQMEELKRKIIAARARLDYLAKTKQDVAEADDNAIALARKAIKEAGYENDSAFSKLLQEAETKIAELATYTRFEPPIEAIQQPRPTSTSLLFAPRLDSPANRMPLGPGPATVFFALARGVLYALDESDGHVLWAMRVGIDGDLLPLMVPASDLHPELAIVISNDGTKCSLAACIARTGEALWQQPLSLPCMGQLLLIGQRIFVPLLDKPLKKGERLQRHEVGIILEIELASGSQIGRLTLGRPLGAAPVRRPGTGQILCPAESRGVYAFDVERVSADGARLDPAYLGMLQTNHEAGSLRGEPIITVGESENPALLILGIADGLDTMKLHPFPLSGPEKPLAIAGEVPTPIALTGWTWFKPFCDSEKLAVVTDSGQFGLFGLKQLGNLDAPIFILPPDTLVLPESRVRSRGQVVHADEETIWVLARGSLHQWRIGFNAKDGLKLVARDKPIPLGEPLQNPQTNARGDTAMVVTQQGAGSSFRATAINLTNGAIRWQRQLGLVAHGEPIHFDENVLIMDQDGGLYQMGESQLSAVSSAPWLIDDRWLVARPLADVVGDKYFFAAVDRQSAYAILTTQNNRGLTITIRHYQPGHSVAERSAVIPAALAGKPIVAGQAIILPLANGLLYRLPFGKDKPLEAGPTWRGERVPDQAKCCLAAIDENEFLAGNGAKSLYRWRWAEGEDDFSRRGEVTISDKIRALQLVHRHPSVDVFVFEARGAVTRWDADKLASNSQPLQAWRPSDKGSFPLGALACGPRLTTAECIDYVIDRSIMASLIWDAASNQWQLQRAMSGESEEWCGIPQRLGRRIFATTRSGQVRVFDASNGQRSQLPGRCSPGNGRTTLERCHIPAPPGGRHSAAGTFTKPIADHFLLCTSSVRFAYSLFEHA